MARTRFSKLVSVSNTAGGAPANKYDPEYCWAVREMAQLGMFVEEWCAAIGITMSTLYNWANRYPEFDQAVHESWYLLRAYWSKQARDSVQGVGRPPSVLIKILETRFPDTWGKTNPRNTQETFENRPGRPVREGEQAAQPMTKDSLRSMDADDLRARIEELERRRSAEKGE